MCCLVVARGARHKLSLVIRLGPFARATREESATDSTAHRHVRDDPNPDWGDWQDCSNLLPGIDRWGYIYQYSSMHRSSLSAVIAVMRMLLEAPVQQPQALAFAPEPHTIRHVTPEEEIEILALADELNTRVAALLAEFE
ncbi:hypothetical protein AHiyo1_51270 [Arthrobacter sp. Hiyo1]|nr:hypothetical protein AHiyo1_51270 [Arthrobacter sp. Hiyo1]